MLAKFLVANSPYTESTRCYEFVRRFYVPNIGIREERVYSRTLEYAPSMLANHPDDEWFISVVYKPIHFICTWSSRIFIGDRWLEFSHNVNGYISMAVYNLSGDMTKFICRKLVS